jgi:hypothetical protein
MARLVIALEERFRAPIEMLQSGEFQTLEKAEFNDREAENCGPDGLITDR